MRSQNSFAINANYESKILNQYSEYVGAESVSFFHRARRIFYVTVSIVRLNKKSQVVSSIASVTFALLACSLEPNNIAVDPNADPVYELAKLNSNLKIAQSKNVDLLSPSNFSKATLARDSALESLSDRNLKLQSLELIAAGQAQLDRAEEIANHVRQLLSASLIARQDAISVGAMQLYRKEFNDLDSRIRDVSIQVEKRDTSGAISFNSSIESAYRALELRAFKQQSSNRGKPSLGQAKDEIEKPAIYQAKSLDVSKENRRMNVEAQDDRILDSIRNHLSEGEAIAFKSGNGYVIRLNQNAVADNDYRSIPKNEAVLRKVHQAISEVHPESVAIQGFSESRGATGSSQSLPSKQAVAIRDFLFSNAEDGVEHIKVRGFGEAYPIASNTNPRSHTQDRGAEIIVFP